VPSRYHVRFADGLSVEILPREADASVGRWAHARAAMAERWRDIFSALRTSGRDAIRLRITLDPKEAQSFYRSLPPAVRLIVLDGEVEPAQPAPAESGPGGRSVDGPARIAGRGVHANRAARQSSQHPE